MEDFKGRVAVITGGASGIGFASAKALANEGCRVVLADIQQDALDAAVAEIAALGADVIGVQTDVTKREALEQLADACWERFGGAHIVFNNAGIAVASPLAETSHDDWRWCIDVEVDEAELAGTLVPVEEVAELVVRGIREKRLYLLPHPESLEFVRRRFDRIAESLEG